jgi:hypothetical protein
MKDSQLLSEVNKAYENSGRLTEQEINGGLESSSKAIDEGKAFLIDSKEADRLMKPTSIRLSPSLKVNIEELAKKEGRSFNNMMTRILESYIS